MKLPVDRVTAEELSAWETMPIPPQMRRCIAALREVRAAAEADSDDVATVLNRMALSDWRHRLSNQQSDAFRAWVIRLREVIRGE